MAESKADLFDMSAYRYSIETLSMQQRAALYQSLASAWSPVASFPTWPAPMHMHPAPTQPFLPSYHWMGGAMMGGAMEPGSLTLQQSTSCATPLGNQLPQADMRRSSSLQHRASGEGVGGSSSSSMVLPPQQVLPHSEPGPQAPTVKAEVEEDDLFRMFDVFHEEDIASSLASGDSINTAVANPATPAGAPVVVLGAALVPAPTAPAAAPSPPLSTSSDTHASLGSATDVQQLPAPTTPVSEPTLAVPQQLPNDVYGAPLDKMLLPCAAQAGPEMAQAASRPARSHSSSSSQLPTPAAAYNNTMQGAATVGTLGSSKPVRTASVPLPTTPASNSCNSKLKQAGGVRKPTSDSARRKQLQAQLVVAASNTPAAPVNPLMVAPPAPAPPVRGVGFHMLPSAFSASSGALMEPMAMLPMPPAMPSGSGGVFSAAAVMSLPEEDTANEVLVNTSGSLCHALSWMEDINPLPTAEL